MSAAAATTIDDDACKQLAQLQVCWSLCRHVARREREVQPVTDGL